MSYRSFKHLLGETSLERKCRFIFGLGILVLVTVSFFLYGQKTESLVRKQTTQTARMLVNPTLHEHPLQVAGQHEFRVDPRRPLGRSLSRSTTCPTHEAWVLNPYNPKIPRSSRTTTSSGRRSPDFVQAASDEDAIRKAGKPAREAVLLRRRHADVGRAASTTAKKEYQYIQAVLFKSICLMDCHGKDKDSVADTRRQPTPG